MTPIGCEKNASLDAMLLAVPRSPDVIYGET